MTKDTETLFYNIRMIIDTPVDRPRAWLISKVNRINPEGICRITLVQDIFDEHHDYIEKDSYGNIIAMWANYFNSEVEPLPVPTEDTPEYTLTSAVTCSGKSQIKIGGSSKTFTITYFRDDEPVEEQYTNNWSFYIDDEDVSDLLTLSPVDANKVRIKFNGGDDYIGKVLTVRNTTEDPEIISELKVDIIPL